VRLLHRVGTSRFDGRRPPDDVGRELVGQGGQARPAVLEPASQRVGCLFARETLEPDGPRAVRAAGGAGPSDDNITTVALVEALGQRQACRPVCLKALKPRELAAGQRVQPTEGLAGAEAAGGQAGDLSGTPPRIRSGGHATRVPRAGIATGPR
jgi:hypothetical protein